MERVRSAGLDPDVKMYDDLIELCVVAGKFGWAMKYINEMSAYGLDLDKVKYRKLFLELVEEQEALSKQEKREKQNVLTFERFKFWVGLPNTYYDELDSS